MSGKQTNGPKPKTKGWNDYRHRRNWDTVSLEVFWSRASKTVSHEGADLELDALTNRKSVKLFLMKEDLLENFGMPPMRWAAALRTY